MMHGYFLVGISAVHSAQVPGQIREFRKSATQKSLVIELYQEQNQTATSWKNTFPKHSRQKSGL